MDVIISTCLALSEAFIQISSRELLQRKLSMLFLRYTDIVKVAQWFPAGVT